MVFNATFNNISVIHTWRSVLLVEETGIPRENHLYTCHKSLTNFYHIILYRVHPSMSRIRSQNFSDGGTYYIGSCKSNYHTITTTTALKEQIIKNFMRSLWLVRYKILVKYGKNEKNSVQKSTSEKSNFQRFEIRENHTSYPHTMHVNTLFHLKH